jgi:hypothetical protein
VLVDSTYPHESRHNASSAPDPEGSQQSRDGARQGPAFSRRDLLFDAAGYKDGSASLYHIDRGG